MSAERADRLDSWKEIASYLRRSVRTARRWEAHEGMPIHRQMHRSRASVYAYPAELDAWLRRQESLTGDSPRGPIPETVSGERSEMEGPSIAVLPFAYVGPRPEDAYLADGFTDEVIANLSRLRGLRVISRTSSMTFHGTDKDAVSIGRKLGVRHLLEGTVRHAGPRLRVSARLIEASRDDRAWSETYEGTIEDVFAIQERIAREIVEALELRLSLAEDRWLAHRPIEDVIAWKCALQARQEALRWRADSIDRAIQLLRQGLSIVGDNAELYAALGRGHLQYREAGLDLGETPLAQAEACAEKVFSIDPSSSAGRRLRAWIHYSRSRIQEAVLDLGAVLEDDWNDPDALGLLSNCYLISGRVDAARPLIERLLAVDPLTPLNRCLPGWADALDGNFSAAVAPYRKMFEMDPENPMARLFYTWILAAGGRGREARNVATGFSGEQQTTLPGRIASFFARGLEGRAIGHEAELSPETERLARATEMFPRFLAQAHALAGDPENAVRWLGVAVDRGFVNHPFLARHDPFFRSLDHHPPFLELLRNVRERWEAFETYARPSSSTSQPGPSLRP